MICSIARGAPATRTSARAAGSLAVPLTHRGRATGVATFFFADLRAIDADTVGIDRRAGLADRSCIGSPANHRESLEAAFADQRKAMAADVP